MLSYVINYVHTYIIHVGAWGAYYGFMCIKDGKTLKVSRLLTLAFLLATFSSLAHNHYMHFLK